MSVTGSYVCLSASAHSVCLSRHRTEDGASAAIATMDGGIVEGLYGSIAGVSAFVSPIFAFVAYCRSSSESELRGS